MNILKTVKRNKMFYYSIIIIGVIMLAFPLASDKENYKVYDVYINDKFVAVAYSEEEALEAFNEAKIQRYMDSEDLTFIEADIMVRPSEATKSKGENKEKLTSQIYSELDTCMVSEKVQAYTIKIDDYTVTLGSREDVLKVLEETQKDYDTNDDFKILLTANDSSGISKMEVNVVDNEEYQQINSVSENNTINIEKDNVSEVLATNTNSAVATKTDSLPDNNKSKSDTASISNDSTDSNEDGIKNIDFKEDIKVFETYTYEDSIKTVDEALNDITKKKAKKERYEVKDGDSLYQIAENFGITLDELLEMNEGMTVDSLILIGDELTVSVPRAEVSIVVEKQETYDEKYEAEIQYIDDESMFIGEETVKQEGTAGKRTVTAMISYTDGVETNREIISQNVSVEAVPEVVHRGTKSIPTYIKPLSNGTLTSYFGPRWGRMHEGVDWGVGTGNAIKATRAGVVTQAGWWGGYGYCVTVDHGDGVISRYGHLSEVQVSVGETVNQGDRLGLSGNTGNSTGPHLHFEIRVDGVAIDPLTYVEE